MWDIGIFEALNFDGGAFWDKFWWVVTGKLTWVPLYLLMIWLFWRRWGWQKALVAVALIGLAVGAADMVCGFFKSDLFHCPRLRPSHTPGLDIALVHGYTGGLYGTVSAHAATTAAIAVIASSIIRQRWFTVVMCVWVPLVCYSRIYVSAHFPQDLLIGTALGIVVGFIAASLWRSKIESGRWKIHRPKTTKLS